MAQWGPCQCAQTGPPLMVMGTKAQDGWLVHQLTFQTGCATSAHIPATKIGQWFTPEFYHNFLAAFRHQQLGVWVSLLTQYKLSLITKCRNFSATSTFITLWKAECRLSSQDCSCGKSFVEQITVTSGVSREGPTISSSPELVSDDLVSPLSTAQAYILLYVSPGLGEGVRRLVEHIICAASMSGHSWQTFPSRPHVQHSCPNCHAALSGQGTASIATAKHLCATKVHSWIK